MTEMVYFIGGSRDLSKQRMDTGWSYDFIEVAAIDDIPVKAAAHDVTVSVEYRREVYRRSGTTDFGAIYVCERKR